MSRAEVTVSSPLRSSVANRAQDDKRMTKTKT